MLTRTVCMDTLPLATAVNATQQSRERSSHKREEK
jgi:hypothetical protein